MKEFKYSNSTKPIPMQNKPIFSKSPQINFSIASKPNNSNLFSKLMVKNPFEPNREREKSPIFNNNYASRSNNYAQNSKSPLKLLNYLYSKQQESNKRAAMNINSNAKQFIQMKIQNNESNNGVYQSNIKKNSHNRAQSMHKDPQATDERREREINNSKDRITDKSPLKIIKNFSENRSHVIQRKSSAQEKNLQEEKFEKSFNGNIFNNFNNIQPLSNIDKIEFKINKNIDRNAIEKQMLEFKRKAEEEKLRILVQKQKEEQELIENNVEENIENNNNKNYNFEPFVNFMNFKNINIKMKPKAKENDNSNNNNNNNKTSAIPMGNFQNKINFSKKHSIIKK